MIIRSLLLLILTNVWAGVCSAQTANNYYLYKGQFFEGLPPGVPNSDVNVFIVHEDEAGHKVTEIRLLKGKEPAEGYQKYDTPVEEVPGAPAFLASARMGMGTKLVVKAMETLKISEWIGKPFPDFRLKDTSGKEWTRNSILGKPMVLNFWYTGCGPCRREMPTLNRWMELYPEVTYLATTFNSAEQIQRIVENTPFRFVQIADELFFFDLFHVSGMPVTILVDKQGVIRYIEEGTGAAKLRYMQDFLQKLTEE